MLLDILFSLFVATVFVVVAAAIIWLVVKFDVAKMGAVVAITILAMAAAAGCFA